MISDELARECLECLADAQNEAPTDWDRIEACYKRLDAEIAALAPEKDTSLWAALAGKDAVHTVDDGFGSRWDCTIGLSADECGLEVVRPGKAQCEKCDSRSLEEGETMTRPNDAQTPTPRTDLEFPDDHFIDGTDAMKFARRLERELTAERERGRRVREETESVLGKHSGNSQHREWWSGGTWLYPGDEVIERSAAALSRAESAAAKEKK